jgi:hypothetical protein
MQLVVIEVDGRCLTETQIQDTELLDIRTWTEPRIYTAE